MHWFDWFGGGWLMMLAWWAIIVGGILLLVKWIAGQKFMASEDSAVEFLKKRYACGEISKEEYEQKKKTISLQQKGRTVMKQLAFTAIAAGMIVVFVTASSQGKQQGGTDQQKRMQRMEMMKDSTMTNMMMDHVASDRALRRMMMQKMMKAVKADSSSMMEMCKAMMGDSSMHSMMMKMMDGGMMKQDMMEKKPTETEQEKGKPEGHEQHHQEDQ